jgi:PPOX class probable F420-dependent enzyme
MPRSTLAPPDRDIIKAPNFCHVAVPHDDGTIQTVVVWGDVDDDDRIVLNTAEGRTWPANLRRAGRATVTVMNLDNPQQYVTVVGRLVEDTQDGANDVIDALARKYTGNDYSHRPGQQRVTLRLEPERVTRREPPQ